MGNGIPCWGAAEHEWDCGSSKMSKGENNEARGGSKSYSRKDSFDNQGGWVFGCSVTGDGRRYDTASLLVQ